MPVCCCSGCLDAQTLTGAGRWLQHMQLFGGSAGFLSDTFYAVLEHVDDNFCDACLSDPLRFRPWFDEWAAAVASAAGVAIRGGCRIIGFVDGTIRPICRPTRNRRRRSQPRPPRRSAQAAAIGAAKAATTAPGRGRLRAAMPWHHPTPVKARGDAREKEPRTSARGRAPRESFRR